MSFTEPVTPLYTAAEADLAAEARRQDQREDPLLARLGALSHDVAQDVRRIYLHTHTVAAYLNLTPAYVAAQQQRNEALAAVDHLHDQLEALWRTLTPKEEAMLQATDLSLFVSLAPLAPARFVTLPQSLGDLVK